MLKARIIPFTEDSQEIERLRHATITHAGQSIPFVVDTTHTQYMRERWRRDSGYYVEFIYEINTPYSGPVTIYANRHKGNHAMLVRRRLMRNKRVQRVQAKRKALDLDQDGKCCGLRTRKASMALRKAEQAWYEGRRAEQPHIAEFEHKTARTRRKVKKHERMLWNKAMRWNETDQAWMDAMRWGTSSDLDRVFAVRPEELGDENYNG